jgi:hypothetical protein
MPYVLAGSHLEYRQFLTEYGLASSTHVYLSKPEQLFGHHGLIVLVGSYYISEVWESAEFDRALDERLTMHEDDYLSIFKGE